MSSPFSSFQEFSEADGPIYTFANNPTMIGFLLILCLAITVYFLYASYTMKQDKSGNSAAAIGLLLVAGAASLFNLFTPSPKQPQMSDRPHPQRSTTAKALQPLALLGMVGIGRSSLGRKRRRKSRR
ncbi:hypothetical protein H6F67_09830 [Microcoleus sp. FACHB-1515]|uniref:hypothetical protein n=1 Tax=Cyanophyceae TaxID=3028117 RepID=UPI001688F085|nr:hypothetical protein [Microcoleus sp. FACHB-1515]MBD2090152.1 hypothetical protein [Microcoleus sp. FACHB-1515]